MIDITRYLKRGLRGTLLLANNAHFSYGSSWQRVEGNLAF